MKIGVASKSTAARLTFFAILFALTLLAYLVPYYDWDLVAYTGAAIALHESNPGTIQTQAYAALQRELHEDDYQDIARGSPFRRDVARNPDHFLQQLRFYQIRPLYIRLLELCRGSGMGYVQATRVLSVLAFFLLGLLLFVWVGRYVDDWRAAIGIPLLLIAPVLFTAARTGSPDALSAFAVTLGAYLLFEKKSFVLGTVLLLISLFLRTDNVIFVFLATECDGLAERTSA